MNSQSAKELATFHVRPRTTLIGSGACALPYLNPILAFVMREPFSSITIRRVVKRGDIIRIGMRRLRVALAYVRQGERYAEVEEV